MVSISRVEIFLDDNVPEYMEGIIRIGSVNYEFDRSNENEEDEEDYEDELELPDLVDNTEFHSENELVKYVAKRLNIDTDIVEIIE